MSDLLQLRKYPTGQHPDAEQLSAFVEHVLPEHERLGTLTHLAECADCREIVALSLPPLEDAAAEGPVATVLPPYINWFRGLGSGWRLVWIAAPALAALVILTIYLRKLPVSQRRAAAPGQVAASHPPVLPAAVPSTAKPVRSPEKSSEKAPERSKAVLGLKTTPGRPTEDAARPRAAAGANGIQDLPASGRNVAAYRAPLAVAPVVKASRFKAAPATASQPSGGPVPVQGSMAGMAAGAGGGLSTTHKADGTPGISGRAQGLLRQPARSAAMAAPAPASSASEPASAAAEPAVSRPRAPVVLDQSFASVRGAAPAPDAAQESATINVSAQDAAVDSVSASEVSDAATIALPGGANVAGQARLPSGRPVLSLAANRHQQLALDTRNQLFVSEDDGEHWKSVAMPWRSRAMRVARVGIGMGFGSGAGIGTGTGSGGAIGAAPHRDGQLALSVPERYTPGATASTEPELDLGSSTSSLSGVITDESGAVIAGATVVATDNHTKLVRTVRADSTGRYLVEELPPGVYRLEAQAAGFLKQSQIAVVGSPQQAVANLALAVGESSQTVTVEVSSGELQTSSRSVAVASAKARKAAQAPPVFVITTASGERWTSPDGLTWKHE